MTETPAGQVPEPVDPGVVAVRRILKAEARRKELTARLEQKHAQAAAWDGSRVGRLSQLVASEPRATWKDRARLAARAGRLLAGSPAGVRATEAKAAANGSARAARTDRQRDDFERDQAVRRRGDALAPAVASGRRLVVATILDPFSRQAFGPEADLVDLHPETWKAELEQAQPDLLLVESAWRGDKDSWHDLVQTRPDELVQIVHWCRRHDVPSVFWNKEDPVYYHRYTHVAELFDHVFTTDVECIPDYTRDLRHDRVHVLPFASQPSVCNPIETVERKHAAVFAGSYYARHTQRNVDLFAQIDGTSRVLPVEIFDRNLGTDNPNWQWPEPYASLVVGTLAPEEIDVAYKGYKVALNVNTVTSSQTMLARRAFDLLASGTPVISNFSPSVKVLFGDLITATNSADEIEAEVRQVLEDPETTDKRRAIGVRHVLRHHTYSHRFRHVLATVTGVTPPQSRPRIGVVATAHAPADVERWSAFVQSEQHVDTTLVVVTDDPAARDAAVGSAVVLSSTEATTADVLVTLGDVDAVAVLRPEHWYGPFYLEGLAGALSYSDAGAVAKLTRFRIDDGGARVADGGREHRWSDDGVVPWHRAAVRPDLCTGLMVSDVVGDDAMIPQAVRVLGVDRFDYCDDVDAPPGALAELSATLPLRTGASFEAIVAAEPRRQGAEVPLSAYPADHVRKKGEQGFVARPSDEGVVVGWVYDDDKNTYLRFRQPLPVEAVSAEGFLHLRMQSDNRELGVNISWLDASGAKHPGLTYYSDSVHRVPVPEDATHVQLYLTVRGQGTAHITSLALSPRDFSPPIIAEGWAARTLVVATGYPAYDDLYRLAFIHTRARAYRAAGEPVDVFTLTGRRRGRREFQGVQVLSGGEAELRQLIESGQYDQVLVHFLHARMWSVLREHLGKIGITVWVHGAEIEPWWRRDFGDKTADLTKMQRDSERQTELWRDVSTARAQDISFVFVSEAFRDQVFEDQAPLGFQLPSSSVHVVHNPVDTELFSYVPKDPEQRKRILLIRPFVSRKYANDLAVDAIKELAGEPWFGELDIRLCGDGPLFDDVTAGLSAFPNVTLDRRFLTHREIAELHKDYGVFLVPTRQDTQGVSRDEAMASGLVPVTSDLPAIREFLSDEEGYIAPYDDAHQLAEAIRDMYHHPDRFTAKSQAAGARVRRTLASSIVTPQELALFRQTARDEAGALR